MIDVLDHLVRVAVILEMALLLASSSLIHGKHTDNLASELRWMVRGLLTVVGTVAVAVTVNALDMPEPTPGAYVVAVASLPATVVTTALAFRVLRAGRSDTEYNRVRRRDVVQHADQLASWLQELEADAPCGHPSCQHKRDDAWRILGRR